SWRAGLRLLRLAEAAGELGASSGRGGRVAPFSECFFFQAEDGIRDRNVTGVQTCALPIYRVIHAALPSGRCHDLRGRDPGAPPRSEERRVGKRVDLGGRRGMQKKKKGRA